MSEALHVAALPAVAVEHVLLQEREERFHRGVVGWSYGLGKERADDGTRTHDLLHGKQTL